MSSEVEDPVTLTKLMAARRQRARCGGLIQPMRIDMTEDERKAKAPKPLPIKRPRSLTIPLTEGGGQEINQASTVSADSKARHWTSVQHQSPLMRLPAELRCIIWEEVVGGNLVHIVRCPQRLLGIQCSETATAHPDIFACPCWSVIFRWGLLPTTPEMYDNARPHSDAAPANILTVLRTCRLIYSETVDLLYRDNVFSFDHLDAVLYFRQTMLRCRLNAIRTVCLQWQFRFAFQHSPNPNLRSEETWHEICTTLASLEGLQALYLRLGGPGINTEQDDYNPILKPLSRITHVKVFQVRVTWPKAVCSDFNSKSDNDFPFKLIGF